MRKKLVLIQVSRALVPILVMLFHIAENMKDYWNYNLLGLSYLPISGGVNYFFALSGFMLFYIYQQDIQRPVNVRGFFLNRFVRIYPLYWILTSIAILALFLFPALGNGHELNLGNLMYSFLLLPNPSGQEPVLDVAWSLVHTVYFYVIFSVLFCFGKKLSQFLLLIWTGISLAAFTSLIQVDNSIFDFLFNQYNLLFLAGILCAFGIARYQIPIILSGICVFFGLIGFPLTWVNDVYHFVNVDFDICTGLSSVFIIFGLASIDKQKNIIIPGFFNYLGNASFAIYLSHNIVLNALSEFFNRLTVFEKLGGVVTSTFLLILMTCAGCFVHSFIEKPLVNKIKKMIVMKTSAKNIRTSMGMSSKPRINEHL